LNIIERGRSEEAEGQYSQFYPEIHAEKALSQSLSVTKKQASSLPLHRAFLVHVFA
jgi:hypothetical protein